MGSVFSPHQKLTSSGRQGAASIAGTDECACCADSPKARDEATGACVGKNSRSLLWGFPLRLGLCETLIRRCCRDRPEMRGRGTGPGCLPAHVLLNRGQLHPHLRSLWRLQPVRPADPGGARLRSERGAGRVPPRSSAVGFQPSVSLGPGLEPDFFSSATKA